MLLHLAGPSTCGWFLQRPPPPPPPPPPPSYVEQVVNAIPLLKGWDAESLAAAAVFLTVLTLLTAAISDDGFTPPPWPKGVVVHHACPEGVRHRSPLWHRLSGAIAATIFSFTYVLVPCLLIAIPTLVFTRPEWWLTWVLAGPFLLSAVVPPIPSRTFLLNWPFRHLPEYFNFSVISESTDEELKSLIGNRACIFSFQPHGVFSFGGASAGVLWARSWWHPRDVPTSAASSVSTTRHPHPHPSLRAAAPASA